MRFTYLIITLVLIAAFSGLVSATEYRTLIGNASDVRPKLHGPALSLEGGGFPAKGAMQHLVDAVRGCTDCDAKLDVVFLDWAPAGSKDRKSRLGLPAGVDSIELITVIGAEPISDEALKAIGNAEIVFFGGGEQCDYTTYLRGPLERAVESVYKRGGGIAGSSAGQAIQGEFVFDGCGAVKSDTGLLTAKDALADPYDPKITFSYNFFNWRYLERTIMDQHVVKRDRLGRTLAFMARQIQDKKAKRAHAIAVDEGTSVVIDRNGAGTVIGQSTAYFITADHKPEVCEKGKPLSYSNFKVWKVKPGETFNLKNRPKSGFYTVDVVEGKLSRDPY